MDRRIKIGISACLLGNKVRYDGGHKLDSFLVNTLGAYLEYVPVCPEVECGMPIPREAMRLVGDPSAPRLVTIHTGKDHTEPLLRWARQKVMDLERENLCGFIFKGGSPSSGMKRVRVYGKGGVPVNKGVGLFARTFMEHFPLLPVEEEGRLHNPQLRENFVEAIFTLKRWREFLDRQPSRSELIRFHMEHGLLLLSHSPRHYRRMERLMATAKAFSIDKLISKYQSMLLDVLRLKSTVKKNLKVLRHVMVYLKKNLGENEKQELVESFRLYARDTLPIIVPITLINHYVRKYDQPNLKAQHFLNPHPIELRLRNHV